jgi:[lysine-biosynthesis-protein LysW]--L-2-aminoadipate ligase
MATVGVLCSRARIEEKALMAALANAGIVSALFPPADEPLPVGPFPVAPEGRSFPVPQLVVDRHPNRQIARAVLTTCQALGVPALCAGLAATGDRLDVASTLSAHGLPRPATALCTSEAAALQAVTAMGMPITLLPLDLAEGPIGLLDEDAAEAVLEHRAVLGGSSSSLGLIQAGAPEPHQLTTVIVVDDMAVAVGDTSCGTAPAGVVRLAEEAARALDAELIAVVVADIASTLVVWDVQPVPDFRLAQALGRQLVAETITCAVSARLAALTPPRVAADRNRRGLTLSPDGIHGGVVVSA